jgi:hypothetical protein
MEAAVADTAEVEGPVAVDPIPEAAARTWISNLGGLGGLLNWALGWAWGGPGWYNAGPGGGWWGGNWWNNWSGSWDRNGNWYDRNGNRIYNNDTFNRTVNRDGRDWDRAARDEFHGDGGERFHGGGGEHFHGGGGEHFHGGGGFHGGGRR